MFSGEGRGWDRTDNASLWVPVVTAGSPDLPWDSVHNGDPSVVYQGGRFVMAFSSTGPGHCPPGGPCSNALPGQAQVFCVHIAQSSDGVRWTKAKVPPLLHTPTAQSLHFPALAPPFNGSIPYFARPSLMWEADPLAASGGSTKGRWRIWCDYLYPPGGMAHAECRGDPMEAGCWRITHNLTTPLIVGWPNAAVIKLAQGRYLAYGDPSGFNSTQKPLVWTARQIREATSSDGLSWTVGDYVPPDHDAPADQVPETLIVAGTGNDAAQSQVLFYACPPDDPVPTINTWMYNRIRFMERDIALPLKTDGSTPVPHGISAHRPLPDGPSLAHRRLKTTDLMALRTIAIATIALARPSPAFGGTYLHVSKSINGPFNPHIPKGCNDSTGI